MLGRRQGPRTVLGQDHGMAMPGQGLRYQLSVQQRILGNQDTRGGRLTGMRRVRARGAAAEAASPEANAISNQKRLPMPARLSTPIRPPIASTRRLQIARPSPEPPNRRRTDPSA
jgi:hypothetical protein